MNRRILRELVLRAATPDGPTLRFAPTGFTAFVGPNNAGKSLVLREIERLASPSDNIPTLLVDSLRAELPTEKEARGFVEARAYTINGQPAFGCVSPSGDRIGGFGYNDGTWKFMANPETPNQSLLRLLAGSSLLRLDGSARLHLVDERQAGDLLKATDHPSHFRALFNDDSLRKRFRELIHDAFDLFPVVDPTHTGHLRLRMSRRSPVDSGEERGWDARALAFHSDAALMQDMSDGVKAYTGVVMTLLVGFNYRVVLVDEPEAFLHPPLARRLGRTMASLATEHFMNVFASTHSADFLFGAVQSGVDVQVVRLTYSKETGATARILPSNTLREWMQDPMLRSTGVLSALFHRSVVIGEGDTDRPFYQEINERLNSVARGAADALFLSGYGKQNAKRLLSPLRQMGIPAAAIVDLDIIKGGDLTDLMRAALAPDALVAGIGAVKGKVLAAFQAINSGYPASRAGLEQLQPDDRSACEHLLRDCAEYGVFIVPGGAVESWLSMLGVDGRSFDWLTKTFRRLGSTRGEAGYVVPGTTDVWAFVDRVADWLNNPQRKGVR